MLDKEADNVFTDFYNSTRDLIADRFSSPFIFSFVISWIITNYKIVMTILTEQTDNFTLDYKFWLINEYLNIYSSFWLPLILATFYTFIYPYIDKEIAKFTISRKNDLKSAKIKIEKSRTKTADEVEKIIEYYLKNERSIKNEINNLRSEIAITQQSHDLLQSKLLEYENKDDKSNLIKKLEVANSFNDESIDNVEAFIINVLGLAINEKFDSLDENKLMDNKNYNRTDMKIAIDSLQNKGLISKEYINGQRGYALKLEVDGLKIFKKLVKK